MADKGGGWRSYSISWEGKDGLTGSLATNRTNLHEGSGGGGQGWRASISQRPRMISLMPMVKMPMTTLQARTRERPCLPSRIRIEPLDTGAEGCAGECPAFADEAEGAEDVVYEWSDAVAGGDGGGQRHQ